MYTTEYEFIYEESEVLKTQILARHVSGIHISEKLKMQKLQRTYF